MGDVTIEECGILVRETEVDGELVGREKTVDREEKEGKTVELWGTEVGLQSEGDVFAVVNEEYVLVMADVVKELGGGVLEELVLFIGEVRRMVLNGMDVGAGHVVWSLADVLRISADGVTDKVDNESGVDKEVCGPDGVGW